MRHTFTLLITVLFSFPAVIIGYLYSFIVGGFLTGQSEAEKAAYAARQHWENRK